MNDVTQRQITEGVLEALNGQRKGPSWTQAAGAIVSILAIAAAAGSVGFVTRSDFSVHQNLSSHPVAAIRIKNVEDGLRETKKELREMGANVILIGEKLRVQGLSQQKGH